jgi:hypothetical protein
MRRPTERARAARASVAATSGEQQRLDGGRPSSRCGRVYARRQARRKRRAAFGAGGDGRRVERRPSVEPSQKRRPIERARTARVSVAATSGEQRRLDGGRPSSRCSHGRVTAQRSTAQETRRVRCRWRRPPPRAAAECRAVAKTAAERAGAESARERRRDERRAAAKRRQEAVEPSRPLACDRAEKHGARDVPRLAQRQYWFFRNIFLSFTRAFH